MARRRRLEAALDLMSIAPGFSNALGKEQAVGMMNYLVGILHLVTTVMIKADGQINLMQLEPKRRWTLDLGCYAA